MGKLIDLTKSREGVIKFSYDIAYADSGVTYGHVEISWHIYQYSCILCNSYGGAFPPSSVIPNPIVIGTDNTNGIYDVFVTGLNGFVIDGYENGFTQRSSLTSTEHYINNVSVEQFFRNGLPALTLQQINDCTTEYKRLFPNQTNLIYCQWLLAQPLLFAITNESLGINGVEHWFTPSSLYGNFMTNVTLELPEASFVQQSAIWQIGGDYTTGVYPVLLSETHETKDYLTAYRMISPTPEELPNSYGTWQWMLADLLLKDEAELKTKGNYNDYSEISEFYCEWSVYQDGVKNSNIYVNWNCPEFGNYTADDILIHFAVKASSSDEAYEDLGYYDYYAENVSFSFKDLATKAKVPWLEELVSNLFPNKYIGSVVLIMRLETSTDAYTSWAYVQIPNNKAIEEYGIVSPSDGSTITVKTGLPTDKDDNYDDGDGDGGEAPTDGEGVSGLNALTTTYKMTIDRLEQLSSFLWGGSFIDNIKLVNNSPIENIISVKAFPFAVPAGNDYEIKLGNVETGVSGSKLSESPLYFFNLGEKTISEKHGSFLDYSPYTSAHIFIPFIGFNELDVNKIMNKKVSVKYIYDVVTGMCKAVVKANDVPIASYEGSCGVDIAITSSNRASVETGYVTGAVKTITALSTGNVPSAVMGALASAVAPYHTQTNGTPTPTCSSYETFDCFVIIDSPSYQAPSTFAKQKGKPCNLTLTLGNLSGFTSVHEDVDLSGIKATREELDEIRRLLVDGIII